MGRQVRLAAVLDAPDRVTGRSTRRTGSSGSALDEAYAASRQLFQELVNTDDADRRAVIREKLVEINLPLAEHLARRFRGRGEELDDLVQVATVALIKSIDRFDPQRGFEFSTYATPTIIGELKRHFRDKRWAVRVPRRLQELRLTLASATAELIQEVGRSPTVPELAARLGMTTDEIIEGLEACNAYTAASLDAPTQGAAEDGTALMRDAFGADDAALDEAESRQALRPLIARLPQRERRILVLRFFDDMTQSQIAREMGISQMHVSRILARTLAELRSSLLAHECA